MSTKKEFTRRIAAMHAGLVGFIFYNRDLLSKVCHNSENSNLVNNSRFIRANKIRHFRKIKYNILRKYNSLVCIGNAS